jgi:ABC-type uncharacterized transport system permease subunit
MMDVLGNVWAAVIAMGPGWIALAGVLIGGFGIACMMTGYRIACYELLAIQPWQQHATGIEVTDGDGGNIMRGNIIVMTPRDALKEQ